jgi:squalene-hopene/tetraprenyl-beta-curcumene cyclase
MNNTEIVNKYQQLSTELKAQMNPQGFWTGKLSTSALSTAVAIVALKLAGNENDNDNIQSGFNWLCQNINSDGGFGDTSDSISNVSTTLLCYAAVSYCQIGNNGMSALQAMEKWLSGNGIHLGADSITRSILKFYGSDYTFSVPILSMLHLCGVIPPSSIHKIPVLPFELTLLPASWYRFFNLRVVSYALPALIGVGIYLHIHRKKSLYGKIRSSFIQAALRKLGSLVPESGGFLEAIPLTGFVAMCLMASGNRNDKTVVKGLEFLRNQQRSDSGWPIDTDLSTWVSTLSVKAWGSDLKNVLNKEEVARLKDHLLNLQYKTVHPFNGAMPGGWGWTSYSGSVPDADDTPGAILALIEMYGGSREEQMAVENGCRWLINLQNNDGGFPTFCRGWGRLPFDKSCADLTGHALLAMVKASEILMDSGNSKLLKKITKSVLKATVYLRKNQSYDGAWLPLWFGNQQTRDKTNPVYGTAKVCIYLNDSLELVGSEKEWKQQIAQMVQKAKSYLIAQQNANGSWGSHHGVPGTIEETALAVSAISAGHWESALKGIQWLETQKQIKASPIGLYFAMLWYDEALYPLIYYTEALRRYLGETRVKSHDIVDSSGLL